MPGLDNSLLYRTLDEYRIERALGSGGQSRVYRALDTRLNRRVALKVMAPDFRADEDHSRRFEREAQSIARLEHPNIVQIYRFGLAEGLYYMAMRYIDGIDLGKLIAAYRARDEVIPFGDVVRIVEQIGAALDYAHSHNIIHRDVKPGNIMIDRQGRAILTDFGLVWLSDTEQAGEIFGSPLYISPEQAEATGSVQAQSDLYSLGVALFQMLTGEPPFNGSNATEVVMKHINATPPNPSELNRAVSPLIDAVVRRALEKQPTARYRTGMALAAAFRQAVEESDATVPAEEPLRMPSLLGIAAIVQQATREAPEPPPDLRPPEVSATLPPVDPAGPEPAPLSPPFERREQVPVRPVPNPIRPDPAAPNPATANTVRTAGPVQSVPPAPIPTSAPNYTPPPPPAYVPPAYDAAPRYDMPPRRRQMRGSVLMAALSALTVGCLALGLLVLLLRPNNAPVGVAPTGTDVAGFFTATALSNLTASPGSTLATLAPTLTPSPGRTLAPTPTALVLGSTPPSLYTPPVFFPTPTSIFGGPFPTPIGSFPTPGGFILPPPADRFSVPPNARRLGEFTVEWYCNARGLGVSLLNNDADWACLNNNGTVAFVLQPTDFDAICQSMFSNPGAFALRDQNKPQPAYSWSCFEYFAGGGGPIPTLPGVVLPPPANRDIVPPGVRRLGEFTVEWYCNDRGLGVQVLSGERDWACLNPDNTVAFILQPNDFDTICRSRFNNPGAFALRDQNKPQPAYNWSCFEYTLSQ